LKLSENVLDLIWRQDDRNAGSPTNALKVERESDVLAENPSVEEADRGSGLALSDRGGS
jgi:hypothetical protein